MSGPQHGTHTHKLSSLLSRIGSGNSLSINNMCPLSSGPLQSPSIAACSSLTEPFETELEGAGISSSQTLTSSGILSGRTSPQLAWPTKSLKSIGESRGPRGRAVEPEVSTRADVGMQGFAHLQTESADIDMSVPAAKEDTLSPLALAEIEKVEALGGRGRFERRGKGGDWEEGETSFAPRYKRGFVFSDLDTGQSRAAGCTETELPVPRPPAKEFANVEAIRTIEDHPQLFAITTPIKINVLEKCLETHPNPEFVQSVMTALREGFWPWADTRHDEEFPITWGQREDESPV